MDAGQAFHYLSLSLLSHVRQGDIEAVIDDLNAAIRDSKVAGQLAPSFITGDGDQAQRLAFASKFQGIPYIMCHAHVYRNINKHHPKEHKEMRAYLDRIRDARSDADFQAAVWAFRQKAAAHPAYLRYVNTWLSMKKDENCASDHSLAAENDCSVSDARQVESSF